MLILYMQCRHHFVGSSRALDNLGRVCVKLQKFDKAIQYWESKLQLLQQQRASSSHTEASGGGEGGMRAKTAKEMALERTWLYHEIGRCHLEQGNNSEAKEYGERALASAKTSEDDVWQLNALVLSAKAEGITQTSHRFFKLTLKNLLCSTNGRVSSVV